jgi:hypothetical protein
VDLVPFVHQPPQDNRGIQTARVSKNTTWHDKIPVHGIALSGNRLL